MVGCCKECALNDEEFNKLLKACELTNKPLENKFAVLMMGRLAMRVGEFLHIKENWIDDQHGVIKIPKREPCRCKNCFKNAKLFSTEKGIDLEEALKLYWRPKRRASIRSIPFNFDSDIEVTVKQIMTKYKKCPFNNPQSIDDHLWKLKKIAGLKHKHIHPQALRSTAATRFAYDGVDAMTLKTIMGWEDIETAISYLASCGSMAQKAFNRVYKRVDEGLDSKTRRVFCSDDQTVLDDCEIIWLKRWIKK